MAVNGATPVGAMPATVETVAVPLGQLHPAPWNPRTVRDSRFQQLCASLTADPAFLWERPILAQADGTIYAGNMRYRAAEHLGWDAVPARVQSVPDPVAKARALRDNNAFGEWVYADLSAMLHDLAEQDVALDTLGFADDELGPLLAAVWAPPALTDLDDHQRPAQGAPLHLTGEQREIVERAVAAVRAACGDPEMPEGRCVELICADYLAGVDAHDPV